MLALALFASLAVAQVPQTPPTPQSAPTSTVTVEGDPVELEDIDVVGRPLNSMIREFVDEVAAPNRGRGIARWDDAICIGAANLRAEPAQYLVDRISTIAEDVGLTPGQPGCAPNVIIIASAEPSVLAEQLIERQGRAFRLGGAGMDRGGSALEAFQASTRPVRWWQVSMPVDSETGARATRIPGECANSCTAITDFAPAISVFAASRLNTQIIENLFRTVVIVDANQVEQISAQQLADYVAMVTLAQIDPEADTSRYASILNVFDAPESASGLTNWDLAYLNGLYDAERSRKNLRAGKSEIAASIRRAHDVLRKEGDDTDESTTED